MLSLWTPSVLFDSVSKGETPTRESVAELISKTFGENAAQFADVAFDRGLEQVPRMLALQPGLEAMKEGRPLPGPDVVEAPGEAVSGALRGRSEGEAGPTPTRREGSTPRLVTVERLLQVARYTRDRGVQLLWQEGHAIDKAVSLVKGGSEGDGFTVSVAVPGYDVVEAAKSSRAAYAVSIPGTGAKPIVARNRGQMPSQARIAEKAREVVASNPELFKDPRVALGGWFDGKNFWLEASVIVGDKKTATRLGKDWNQQGIMNLKNLKDGFIPTGGDGSTPKGFKFRRAQLNELNIKMMGDPASTVDPEVGRQTPGQRKVRAAQIMEMRAELDGIPLAEKLLNTAKELREQISRKPGDLPGSAAIEALRDISHMEGRAIELLSGVSKEPDRTDATPIGASRSEPNSKEADTQRIDAAHKTSVDEGHVPVRDANLEVLNSVFTNPEEAINHLANLFDSPLVRDNPAFKGSVPTKAQLSALETYLGRYISYVGGGEAGAAPKMPKVLRDSPLAKVLADPVKLIGDLRAMMSKDATAFGDIRDSAMHQLPFDSAGASMLKSGLPPLFMEVNRMLAERGLRISPKMRMQLDDTVLVKKEAVEQAKRTKEANEKQLDEPDPDAPVSEQQPVAAPDATLTDRQKAFAESFEALGAVLPPSAEFYHAGKIVGDRFLREFDNQHSGDTKLSANAFDWGHVNLWDYVRPGAQFTLRKILPGPAGEAFVKFVREQGIVANARRASVVRWLDQELADLRNHMKDLEPEQAQHLQKQIIKIREGDMEIPEGMHPSATRALSAIKHLLDDYAGVLKAMGKKVRKNYFPHIFEHVDSVLKDQDPKSSSRLKELKSRFFNPRKSDADGFVEDLHRVLDIYVNSVERVLTWQPVRDYWTAVQKRAKDAGSPVPVKVEEYMGKFFDVLEGRPGSIDRFMNFALGGIAEAAVSTINFGGAVATLGFKRNLLKKPGIGAGRKFIRGWLSANYIGALGGSLMSPIKNLTANLQTFSTLGPVNWGWAMRNFLIRDPNTGEVRLNPLVEEMQLWEQGLAADVKREQESFRSNLSQMGRDVSDVLMSLFDASEVQLRGVAGLAALREYLSSRGFNVDTAPPEVMQEGMRAARDAAARTQAEYTREMGGIMFGSETGRAAFQFGRFSFHYLDLLQLMTRAAVPGSVGRNARRMIPPYAAKDGTLQRLRQATTLMGGLLGMSTFLTGLGISIAEIVGPGGGVPEVAKEPVNFGVELVTSFLEDDEREAAQTARDVNRFLGTETRGDNPWASLFNSFGPAPGQVHSVISWATSFGDPTRRKEANAALKRAFKVTFPGLPASRALRFFEESRTGMIASSVAGDRLFPNKPNLDPEDAFLRLAGFTPSDLAEEYDLLTDRMYDRRLYNTMTRDAKLELFRKLDKGVDRLTAVREWVKERVRVLGQYNQHESIEDTLKRARAAIREYEEKRKLTRRERIEDRFPFRRGDAPNRIEQQDDE